MRILVSTLLAGFMVAISAGAEIADHKPVEVAQLTAQIEAGVQLLDVRTKEEWAVGHLKGAKLIPVSTEGFADKAKAILNTGKPVIVYCHSGKRSAKAAKLLRAAGFTTVLDMAGGIVAWEKEGRPVVK